MTNQWRQRKALIRSGCFKDEAKAWSQWDWASTPWLTTLRRERSQLVTRWCKETGRKRSDVSPETLRLSFTYRRMVRQWYADHGWMTKSGTRDAFACLRAFREPWARTPEGKKSRSPWKVQRIEAARRRQAIDEQFSRAPGLQVI